MWETCGISKPPSERRIWRAPGRVNIIGEHIDYLGGTVLPFACNRELSITATPTDTIEFIPSDAEPYVDGVVQALRESGAQILNRAGRIDSTIPIGAGMSSSAALAAALALALTDGAKPDPRVLQKAEQLATGVPCGVMDQTAVVEAIAGHALLLDCATGAFEHLAIAANICFVVIDTGTRRELKDGRYAQRRAEAEAGHPKRKRHTDSEQRRVFDAADALRAGDIGSLGVLLDASHTSLRDDFEVSSEALDAAVLTVSAHEACAGARLMGAGFAGCVIAAVQAGSQQEVSEWVMTRLSGADAFGVEAVDGAGEVT